MGDELCGMWCVVWEVQLLLIMEVRLNMEVGAFGAACAKAQPTNPIPSIQQCQPGGGSWKAFANCRQLVDPRVRNQKILETKMNYIHVAERTLGRKKK